MPKHFTAEQFAVSAAVGDLLTQKSFGGDTQAWHTYQDTVLSKLHPGALPATLHTEGTSPLWVWASGPTPSGSVGLRPTLPVHSHWECGPPAPLPVGV